jgi:hypothetical protein
MAGGRGGRDLGLCGRDFDPLPASDLGLGASGLGVCAGELALRNRVYVAARLLFGVEQLVSAERRELERHPQARREVVAELVAASRKLVVVSPPEHRFGRVGAAADRTGVLQSSLQQSY